MRSDIANEVPRQSREKTHFRSVQSTIKQHFIEIKIRTCMQLDRSAVLEKF